MKIKDVICSPGRTGFFFDDQKAIKAGAVLDGNAYFGDPVTPGFTRVRQAGEAISIMFVLDDGQVALGDCAAVQYSGTGGRDPLFLASDYIPFIYKELKPNLIGREITSFKEMAEELDHFKDSEGKRLHTAIRYGITQAVLDACSKKNRTTMAQVVADEYGLTVSDEIITIFSQSGDDRYANADKMILKGSACLPHGLFNSVEKLGHSAEHFLAYIEWLRDRILKLRADESYNPVLHIDVYGNIGAALDNDLDKITDVFAKAEECAKPFHLRIEGPMDVGAREAQMEALRDLRKKVDERGINVEIVADEWCNTFEDVVYFTDNKAGHMAQIKTPDLGGINNSIEAVLYCKENGMGAYLGGTCNETNISAQACANVAMATSPDMCLAKPGMGVDEGYMIMYNEMNRILALKNAL